MTDSMIERVARGLATSHYEKKRYYSHRTQRDHVAHLTNVNWRNFVKDAKVSISLIREPSTEMKTCDGVHWGYSCNTCGGLQEGWYAMIDAALKGAST